jgi:hypothetical protein
MTSTLPRGTLASNKIGFWLVKIPKAEVRLACVFFVSAVESFEKLPL